MAANIDQTLGMKLDADFQNALNQLTQLASKLQTLQTNLSNAFNATKKINNFANQLQKLNKMDVDKLQSQLTKVSQQMSKFNDQMKKVDTSGIDRVSASLKTLIENARTAYQSMQKVTSSTGSGSKKSGSQFTGAEKVNSAVQQQASSIRQQTALAYNGAERLEKKAHSLAQTLKRAFTVGNVIYFWNMMKSIGQSFSNMLMKPIDFAETENLFTAAFGRMRDEAYRFGEDLSEAFGLALPDILQMEATFKNMLGSLGGLAEETSTQLSATMTKMTIDFASLYNVSIESASQKMQSALSRQVRPIRSVSGYDITQNVLGGTAEDIGITDRSIRDMTEMEKRLLIIITLQNQMARSAALGDFANTIESSSNQLKILQQQISETGRWLGSVFMGTIGKILPYINGFVMAIQEVIKSLAFFVGYELPDTGDIDRNILDSMGDGVDTVNSGLEETNDQLDDAKKKTKEWKNFLASFDVANVIPDQSESDSGSSSSSDAGVASDYIDPRILAALKDYDNLMYSVQMKAHDIRETILDAMNKLGTLVNDHIFKPITNSWNEYGEPIINNLRKAGSNIEYILGGAVAIAAARWDEAFQQISDTFFSFVDTASLIASTVTEFFKYIWDFGGAILFNSIISLVESLAKLAQAINDDFIKPVIRTANDVLVPVFGGAIGTVLGFIGGLIEGLSRLISWISDIEPVVVIASSALTAFFIVAKTANFVSMYTQLSKVLGGFGALKSMLLGSRKTFAKLWIAIQGGKGKIAGTFEVLKNFNDLLANTKAWKVFSSGLTFLSDKLKSWSSKLAESGGAVASLGSTITSKLGSALTWLAQNPVVAVIAALGGLIAIMAALGQSNQDAELQIEDCSEAIQNQYEEYKSLADSIKEAKDNLDDTITSTQLSADTTQTYIDKLRALQDENGYVDDLDTAKYLIEQINQVLPDTFEITEDGLVVQKKSNDEIQKSIDLYIKQAEAQAYQEAYVDAKKEEIELQKKLREEMEKLAGMYDDERKEYEKWVKDTGNTNISFDTYKKRYGYQAKDEVKEQEALVRETTELLDDSKKTINELKDGWEDAVDSMGKSTKQLAEDTSEMSDNVEKAWRDMYLELSKNSGKMTEEQESMLKTMLTAFDKYGIDIKKHQSSQYYNMMMQAQEFGIDFNSENASIYAEAIALLDKYGYDVEDEQMQQHIARLITAAENGDEEGKRFVSWLKSGVASENIDPEVKSMMDDAQETINKNRPLVKFKAETANSIRKKLQDVLPKNLTTEVKIKAVIDSASKSVVSLISGIMKNTFGKFADGGFPNVGQMFIARESGPELVGTMRGRTAVANNYQIEDGIYRAVRAAMSSVTGTMRGGDLYITIQNEDGTKIEKVIRNYNDYITRNGGKGGFIV